MCLLYISTLILSSSSIVNVFYVLQWIVITIVNACICIHVHTMLRETVIISYILFCSMQVSFNLNVNNYESSSFICCLLVMSPELVLITDM